MNILVLGGTQLTGLHLVPRLLQEGHRVTVLTRGNRRPAFLQEVEHIRADRGTDGLAAVAGRRFDAVVDNIAYEPEHIQQVVDALGEGAGHYILNSTVFVAEPLDHALRPIHEEDADLEALPPGFPEVPHSHYVRGKRRCELYLRRGLPFFWTVLRPASVFGETDPQHRLRWWLARVLDGGPILLPDDFPELHGVRNNLSVYAGDVATAQLACLGNPATRGRAYFVAGEDAPSIIELVSALATAVGRPAPELVAIPRRAANATPLAANAAGVYRVPGLWPGVRLDVSAIRRDLGWKPTPLAEWLPAVVGALATEHAGDATWPAEIGYGLRPLEVRVARAWQRLQQEAAERLRDMVTP